MKTVKKKLRAGFLAAMLVLFMGTGIVAVPAHAASGSVYSCSITGCYSHPVTGEIEDSGGESSYELGSSMVSSAVYTNGILEVTSDGQYYVTIRMSLMDYTSNHQFWVQNVGDSGWMTGAVGTTGTGSDSNGATADYCIQVPSESSIIRCSMYVTPMGRDVVFYIYPSNYTEGNNTNMAATIVTESASAGTTSTASEQSSSASTSGTTSSSTTSGTTTTAGTTSGTTSTGTTSGTTSTGTGSLSSSTTPSTSAGSTGSTTTTGTTGGTLSSSLDGGALTTSSGLTSASTDTATGSDDSELSQAEGLSLSTAGDASDTGDGGTETGGSSSSTKHVFAVAAAFTCSALILICAVAGLIYLFRRNWYRWGGGDYDDE